MPSGVSALSSLVANGHQAVHHVSSSLSETPYGGFSPVRLQTELASRHLRPGRQAEDIDGQWSFPASPTIAPRGAIAALSRREGIARPDPSVQRPLARHRVFLSRRVIAYYGLIRASGLLQTTYLFRRLVFALRLLARRSLLSAANPSRRATSRTPADRAA